MTDNLFDSLMACLNRIPSTDIPKEVSDFIQMISSAKYSTFLTAEKEAQYHALNIDAIITAVTNFDASCKTSILFIPTVQKYISSLRSQQASDNFL